MHINPLSHFCSQGMSKAPPPAVSISLGASQWRNLLQMQLGGHSWPPWMSQCCDTVTLIIPTSIPLVTSTVCPPRPHRPCVVCLDQDHLPFSAPQLRQWLYSPPSEYGVPSVCLLTGPSVHPPSGSVLATLDVSLVLGLFGRCLVFFFGVGLSLRGH